MKKNIVIGALLVIVMSLVGYIGYDKFSKKEAPKKIENKIEEEINMESVQDEKFTIPEGATTGNVDTTDNINYNLDISSYKANDVVYYKLNDKYTVKLRFYDISSFNYDDKYFKNFDISVNDILINSNSKAYDRPGTFAADDEKIQLSLLDDYLIFNNFFWTDIRSTDIYVVSIKDNVTKEFGEMEKIQGMLPSSKEIVTKDGLTIEGNRLDHLGIAYNGNYYEVCNGKADTLPSDTIFSATYFYKYKDGKLDLDNPEKTNIMTIKEYINNSKNNCNN